MFDFFVNIRERQIFFEKFVEVIRLILIVQLKHMSKPAECFQSIENSIFTPGWILKREQTLGKYTQKIFERFNPELLPD